MGLFSFVGWGAIAKQRAVVAGERWRLEKRVSPLRNSQSARITSVEMTTLWWYFATHDETVGRFGRNDDFVIGGEATTAHSNNRRLVMARV
jgi:hypothetical protein